MLVLSRKPGEEIHLEPNQLAAEGLKHCADIGPGSFLDAESFQAFERVVGLLEQLAHDEVRVMCVRIGPNVVRLGVTAQRSRRVMRTELIGRDDTQPGEAAA